jgi:NAD(P)-dependent dehydrogenase (short-subunit alcohol dehydrogenase family)
MTTLTHRVALITGASQGLGLEIARRYAARGLGLILTARHRERLEAVTAELSQLSSVLAIAGDVADASHRDQLVADGLARFGQIDVLINNASELGPSPLTELAELDLAAFERILAVNLVAPLGLMQRVLPGMRIKGSGLIVNVTSDAGVEAYPTWGGYGASKAGLEHLSRVMAAELEGSGIRLYVIDPGDMDTAMHRAAEPGADLSHLPSPQAVAPVFVDLLGDDATFGRFEAQRLLEGVV